jgi:DNA-binding YbaB/EbfC family protein
LNKDMQRMMKQAQKMAAQMQEAQSELAEESFEGAAGGGAVKATIQGDGQIVAIKIDPGFFEGVPEADDIEMLEDSVVAALRQAMDKVAEAQESRMGPLGGGLGGLGLPGT